MSNHEDIEIGWKKELLEDSKEENRSSTSRRRNRSPGKKKKYHRLSSRSSSSSSCSSTSSSSSDDRKKKKDEKNERRQKRKEEKELKKEKRRQEKAEKKLLKQAKKEQRKEEKKMKKLAKKLKGSGKDSDGEDCAIPIDLMYNKSHAPETQQEYEARQSQIRRIVDPDTGRTRLIKGDGEILEEIVSKDRHKEINKQATRGDGNFFQSKTIGWKIPN